jgi:hypothetical protein
MRSLSTRARGIALLTLLVVLAVPMAYADDQNPYEPPEARIRPPIGSEETGFFELLLDWVWLYARIGSPIG